MPTIRTTVGAAIGCLFVCALFGGGGVTQTVSAQAVGKPMQLPKPEGKTSEKSAAKRASKAHPAAKKPVSTQAASMDITNGARQVTAPPNEPVIDGEAMRVTSPQQANDISLVANAQAPVASDVSPAVTIAPADQSNSGAAAIAPPPSGGIGRISWLLWIVAAVSGAVATGSMAWFLIGPNVSADIWVSLRADPEAS